MNVHGAARADSMRRGHLLVPAMFLCLIAMVLVGLVWNVGLAVERKQRAQAAADSGAMAAATVIARSTNTITNLNRLIIRCASAEVIHEAGAALPGRLNAQWAAVASAAAGAGQWEIVEAVNLEREIFYEWYTPAMEVADPLIELIGPRITQLHLMQDNIYVATDGTVKDTQSELAAVLGVDLYITSFLRDSDGDPRFTPPVAPGNAAVMQSPLRRQVHRDREGWMTLLQAAQLGGGPGHWADLTDQMVAKIADRYGGKTYRLLGPSQIENTPNESLRQRRFSVIAAASLDGPPDAAVLMGNHFTETANQHDRITALAQAEVFNPLDAGPGLSANWSWRVWETPGAHWAPRLAPLDALGLILDEDPELIAVIEAAGTPTEPREDLLLLVNH